MDKLKSNLGKLVAGTMLSISAVGINEKNAIADVIDPHNYANTTETVVELVAPENSPRQSINLTLDTTLPVPYEGQTELTNGWVLEVAPIDNEGNFLSLEQLIANDNRLPALGVRIFDTNSSYKEIRKIIPNANDENEVYGFTLPDLRIILPDNPNEFDLVFISQAYAFNGGDGSNMIMFKPSFPRILEFPEGNVTTYHELMRTQDIIDESNRIPLGYENCDRVSGVETINLQIIPGMPEDFVWNNDYNVSGCLWLPPGELGASGTWTFGYMKFDRVTANPNIIRGEFDSFKRLIATHRADGAITDGENLAHRLGDAIPRNTAVTPRTAFMNDFYEPNSSVEGAGFPEEKPPFVVLQIPLSGEMTEGQLHMFGAIPTEKITWGELKSLYK